MTSIIISLAVSFAICAIAMSCYKEDFKIEYNSDKNFIYSLIKNHTEELDILRARVYDLETKIKEMEKVDDGK